jgi:hypothetical protein
MNDLFGSARTLPSAVTRPTQDARTNIAAGLQTTGLPLALRHETILTSNYGRGYGNRWGI